MTGRENGEDGFRATVPAEVMHLVSRFMESRRGDVAELRRELTSGELDALLSRAHTVKGSAGGYGFHSLSDLAGDLERAVHAGDLENASAIVERMGEYLERVVVVAD